jgi:hypothetical protein
MSETDTPRPEDEASMADALVLDANAVAGDLEQMLGFDVTVAIHRCASCGNVAEMGTLLAYTGGPGTVLRCAICRSIVLRFARTPTSMMLDVRGAAWLSIGAAPPST